MTLAVGLSAASLAISVASLAVACWALWIVHLRPGALKMTQPTMIFFGRDRGSQIPKLFLRALLFSTSARGQIVENMYIRLLAPVAGPHKFDFWTYGEKDKLSRGSGLFVSQSGAVWDNHFMLRPKVASLANGLPVPEVLFWPGEYTLEVFAKLLAKSSADKIMQLRFSINGQQNAEMIQLSDAGLFFDLDVETGTYIGHVERDRRV